MSQATYLRDMMTDPEWDLPTGPSEVASFYAGRNVLLTGGSGFLGRLLIEKILRCCPDVNTLLLLLREKKGKSPRQRLEELFNDVIFDRLHKERPDFAKKVILIEGDMVQVGLGLSPEHRALLRTTHIVIHSAATVRFDEKVKMAVSINIRGTKELLSFAEEMLDLKAFVYISTAYCNCVQHEIEEVFYPPPIDSEKLLHLVEILDDAALDHLAPVLLGKWPNTYAFSKAVAEDVVRRAHLPACVVRPSIVIATSKEPVAGWINNVYGPTGVYVGSALGLLRSLHCDENMVADLIPADYVVNSIIVAAWDTAKARILDCNGTGSTTTPEMREHPIYNVVSSCQKRITWGEYMKYNFDAGIEVPSTNCIWFYYLILNKSLWVHNFCVLFLHLLPAAIVDGLSILTGKKPMLWKAYGKIRKFSAVIEYFTMQQWRFHNNNVLRLEKRLSHVDRSRFDLDVGGLDWEEYYYSHARGIRAYIFSDPLDTLPEAVAKYNRLKVAHYTLVTLVCGFLLWLLRTILRFIVPW